MPEFKSGDIVLLQGGGPVMTVEVVDPDGTIHCIWFDSENKFFREKFGKDTLRKSQNQAGR